MFITNQNPLLN